MIQRRPYSIDVKLASKMRRIPTCTNSPGLPNQKRAWLYVGTLASCLQPGKQRHQMKVTRIVIRAYSAQTLDT